MKKIVFASVLVLSTFSISAFAEEWTGYISDSKCAANPAKVASEDHAACAAKCVKGGASAVFVSDGKVYQIDDQSKVADHVGHKVTITGKLEGDTVKVDSVKM